ncbi:MAG TPA: DUF3866 family protein [Acidimicrobiales bacterium]|nr:DUF3866 family protein [Acidimicrobiales bacterium]
MPTFRTATVSVLLAERPGLQRVEVDFSGDDAGARSRAYVLTQLTGPVEVGDEVIVNTTAVELGLGTGGWHVVHWNLACDTLQLPGPGHIMKLRYTSLQVDTGAAEELHAGVLAEADDLDGVPVVVCGLHSQVPCVASAFKHQRPDSRVVYLMTDGAALPLALSDLVAAMVDVGLVDGTVTAGHAFGGDHEAVNVASGLLVARHLLEADLIIVAMGPGVVGTATRLGYSALEVGPALDLTETLGGQPVAAVRYSLADPRLRHQGVSHHSLTALALATRARATIGVPAGAHEGRVRADLDAAGLTDRHRLLTVEDVDVASLLALMRLRVTSMGRTPDDDPGFFAVAGAAGTAAAALVL